MQTEAAEPNRFMDILLVEDNPGDVRLAHEAFNNENSPVNLYVAGDGKIAMSFLRREGKYSDAPRPNLILLDLNLPKMDGRETLAQIKQDEDLKVIPTIILTTSDWKPIFDIAIRITQIATSKSPRNGMASSSSQDM